MSQSQQLQKRNDNPIAEFRRKINEGSDKLTKWCQEGSEVTPATLIRWAELAVQREPKFQDPRTWRSIFFALVQAAQLGLEPNGFAGDGWIVPFWNPKLKHNEASFMPGYKGIIKLLRRSGEIRLIRSHVVLEGDDFEVEFDSATGGGYRVIHRPNLEERGDKVIAAFSVAYFADGSTDVEVVDASSIDRARAAGHGDTPAWKTWPDQMARKVALRRHANQLPMDAVARRGIALDGALAAGDLDRARQITEADAPEMFVDVTPAPEPQIHAVPELPPADPEPAPQPPPKSRSKAPASNKPAAAPRQAAAPAHAPSSSAAERLKEKVRERRGKSAAKAAAEPPPTDEAPAEAWEEGEAGEAEYLRAEIAAGRITDEIRDRVRALEGDVKIELVLAIDEASGYGSGS